MTPAGMGVEGQHSIVPLRPQLPLVPLIVAACLVAVGLLAFNTGRNALRNYQLRQDAQALREDVRTLEREQEQLAALREYLGSNEYVEEIARRVLGLVKPGETLVIVSGTEDQSSVPQAAERPPGTAWWKALFDIAEPTPEPSSPLAP
jgi:cell division protein FtsB